MTIPELVDDEGGSKATTNATQVFATTHWSVIHAAGGNSSPAAKAALTRLCTAYWPPVYSYIRRSGRDVPDAQDLTQSFFARLIEHNWLARVNSEQGRFRSYLLGALKHFLADEHDRATALKRGGGREIISLDADQAETRYQTEPANAASPDVLYERQFVLTLLDQALDRLRSEYVADGRRHDFEVLCGYLTNDSEVTRYQETAVLLGWSEAAVKSAVWRLRQRHRELVRLEFAQIVTTPAELEDEIRHGLALLAR